MIAWNDIIQYNLKHKDAIVLVLKLLERLSDPCGLLEADVSHLQ
jgi:hypothetical protein